MRRIFGVSLVRWCMPILFAAAAIVLDTAVSGYDFSGLVCLGVAGILLSYNLFSVLEHFFPKQLRLIRRIFTALLCAGLAVVTITGVLIVRAAHQKPQSGLSYVVLLGCQVKSDGPSLPLQNRIDRAYAYLSENPQAVCVLSGGQGADEPVSEAQYMFDCLTAMGIAPERLWIEDRSTSTWENLHFSLALIEEKTGRRPETIGLLSSEYHIFRASLFAKVCGVEATPIPATTTWMPLRINNYLREIAGVWHYIILGG